jgi:rhamnogalacturonan endolyase
MEYMSGGPTKVEFQGHRDTNATNAPCVLNYWRSSHYGGAEVNVADGEQWRKVIGPFMLYVNSGTTPQAMFDDAKAQQKKEAAAWPYEWVAGVDFPRRAERATVKGQLTINDPLTPGGKFSRVLIGLVAPDYISPRGPGPNGAPAPRITVNWQTDAKHYQFWVRGDEAGRFEIPKVRPGKYSLRAFADGVLGELVRDDVTVEPGKTLDLGKIEWTPMRRGKQLWEVGIPNRNGSEFFKGDVYWEPEISLEYAKLFPTDVNFVVGKSDFRKDWFFQHVPHNENPNARATPFSGITSPGRATPFSVSFDLAEAPKGKATLRLAICGTGTRELEVLVNDQSAGRLALRPGDGTITRHGSHGIWYERELAFDAALMKMGQNALKLVVPAGPVNNGVMYDYIRLELDEATR